MTNFFSTKLKIFYPFFQLRGAQILDAVRLHKNGFPENLSYGEFWRRYRILSDELQKRQPSLTEMKASVEDLLADMDLDKSAFRLGNTQVSHFWPLLFQVSAKITSIHFQRDGFLYLIVWSRFAFNLIHFMSKRRIRFHVQFKFKMQRC